jgi:hypothetical protein
VYLPDGGRHLDWCFGLIGSMLFDQMAVDIRI